MSGLGACKSLVELYLSHNGIWALDAELTQLRHLKVGACHTQSLAPVHVHAICFGYSMLCS